MSTYVLSCRTCGDQPLSVEEFETEQLLPGPWRCPSCGALLFSPNLPAGDSPLRDRSPSRPSRAQLSPAGGPTDMEAAWS